MYSTYDAHGTCTIDSSPPILCYHLSCHGLIQASPEEPRPLSVQASNRKFVRNHLRLHATVQLTLMQGRRYAYAVRASGLRSDIQLLRHRLYFPDTHQAVSGHLMPTRTRTYTRGCYAPRHASVTPTLRLAYRGTSSTSDSWRRPTDTETWTVLDSI